MKRKFKAISIASLVIIVPLIAAAVTAWLLTNRKPDWYPAKALSQDEIKQAAKNMDVKFTVFREWANETAAQERRVASGRPAVATDPTTAPAASATISLTDTEMNAYFTQWDDLLHWEDKYNHYLTDPILVLQDNRLILAGNVPEVGKLVSMHIDPRLDEQGKLRLDIAKVMGGSLPVPRAFYERYQVKLASVLAARIDRERKKAKLNSDGSANISLISASMNELLVHALKGEPAEPILFIPYDLTKKDHGLPVRITDVKIKAKTPTSDATISLTVVPLTPTERKELVDRVRQSDPPRANPAVSSAKR